VTDHVEVRPRTYHDSVRLMQVSASVQAVDGVEAALVAMGTNLNVASLAAMGFPDVEARPDDMIVAIRAADGTALDAALAVMADSLAARAEPETAAAPPPRTIEGAAAAIGANLALISVPGPHAYVEAAAALRAGLHVMVFSNNVTVEHELALKREGAERGLLVMGPDCGTAIVHGVGLGFANAVVPGPVGIVGASGTGIQQVCCLLDGAGVGVRHALGTGSRDLSAELGAASTLAALAALDRDQAVELIVVVSKPPAPDVARRVREAAAACATPAIVAMVGETTLEDAVAAVAKALGREWREPQRWEAVSAEHRPGVLRGLFSGGTLCSEAAMVAGVDLGPVAGRLDAGGHAVVDLGADEFTRGRPHPMIDQRFRIDYLDAAAGDDAVGVILLDVVLGYGAHPDPATELAPHVEHAVGRGAAVVASLCGTAGDPQGRDGQAEVLAAAGAGVFFSNAAAARHAAALAKGAAR
jgi:FdrA protein